MSNQPSGKSRIEVQDITPPAEVSELDPHQKREKIYTRKMEGFFQRIRLFTGWPLLLGFFFLPWLSWGGRQLVLFDLPARKFHIFMFTFWPQDFKMLAWLLIIAAMGLFLVTIWAGRVWCGYTCPQTVWTSIFMWIEQRVEGSRNQRIKLDKAPWSAKKVFQKLSKHGMWIGVSLITGITFVGYFYPARELLPDLLTLQVGGWTAFFLFFFTWTTYVDAGWLREKVCMHACPYARFQAVMFDKDTLIVAYDEKRGEPRGSRKKSKKGNVDSSEKNELGDCIDCQLCVQVCPTGIDIRNGLQYQCITCALCIDACDSVMDKMAYPKGLISYTSEHQLSGEKQVKFRPRLIGYALVCLAMILNFGYHIATRIPVELDIIRDRNTLYNETADGYIENVYTLKIMNMDQKPHTYTLSAEGIKELKLLGQKDLSLKSGEVLSYPLRLQTKPDNINKGNQIIHFTLTAVNDPKITSTEESRFIGPTKR